jgi:tetratricopeptide (TPR) repeat protein
VENTAEYFGKTFGLKLIPSWTITDRSYFLSKNIEMKKAEELCKNGEWIKAAEIYKRFTLSKNKNISAKAKYNMALICEMEGDIDAAIDWLNKSKSDQNIMLFSCKEYAKELEKRKQELNLLDAHIKNKSEINDSMN